MNNVKKKSAIENIFNRRINKINCRKSICHYSTGRDALIVVKLKLVTAEFSVIVCELN